ncbi:MAG: VTT domain-containing protein [Eubacteriales bacterium]|nr:VTT domain-containing protein [Eubacteriales bacterium]MDY3332661.1 VTT domain-containing protein [Gallibacter sp.]
MKNKKIIAIIKFSILIFIIVGIPLYLYLFQWDWLKQFADVNKIKAFFQANEATMIPLYILFQILQIVISIIPGQWLQIGFGYFYGIMSTLALSLIGAFIGSIISYYLSRYLGRDALRVLVKPEKVGGIVEKLKTKKALIFIFLIYLIPGLPKDLCNYAAGIAGINLKLFLIVSMIGRTPGMLGSIIIGHQINAGGYLTAIIIASVATILFLVSAIFHKKLSAWIDRISAD